MAKKRSMPHGRTVPKAKKASPRVYTPVPADVERAAEEYPESNGTPAKMPSAPAPRMTAPRSVIRTAPTSRAARSGGAGLSTDYRYVISDLKRIGILAIATFGVLVALTFVVK